jgi:sulfate adenylyltransferase
MINKIILDKSEFLNLINIGLGYYKPIKQFCTFSDYTKILKKRKVNNHFWTIPILLNFKKKIVHQKVDKYFLFFKGKKVGYIKPESRFKIDKKHYCSAVFKTNSKKHPGVKKIYKTLNSYVGGKTYFFKSIVLKNKFFLFNQMRLKSKNISNSVAFITRNICHLGHQSIHQEVLKKNKNLTICIIESEKNKYDTNLLINSYLLLKKKNNLYKNINVVKILLPSLFAGPNETYLQATILNNNNFKKFVVGRDHAGIKNFYNKYASQKIFLKNNRLKIKIIKTREPLMCSNCNTISFHGKKTCKCIFNKRKFLEINGRDIKSKIINNKINMISRFVDPTILNFCKKNAENIRKFKG